MAQTIPLTTRSSSLTWWTRLALGLAVVATVLTGCGSQHPQQKAYGSGDGLVVLLDDTLVVSSLLLVADGPDGPAALVARVTNTTAQGQVISFSGKGLKRAFTVSPHTTLAIGGVAPGSVPVVVDPTPAAAGRNTPMTVTANGARYQNVQVPVLSWTFEHYAPYRAVAQAGARPS